MLDYLDQRVRDGVRQGEFTEEQAKADFKKLNEAYRDSAQKANFYSTMIMPVSGNLMNISYALTAAFGGLLSVIQGFDLGGWWSISTTPSRWASP